MKLKQGRFAPNPAHRYSLPPGVMVQSAKFGRTQADIWLEPEPTAIYRDGREVGRASRPLWKYVLHGEGSGTTTSETAARATAESAAWRSQANHRSTAEAVQHYALTDEEQAEERAAFSAYLADIESRFGADVTT